MAGIGATVIILCCIMISDEGTAVLAAWKGNLEEMRNGTTMDLEFQWDDINGNQGNATYSIKFSNGKYVYETVGADGTCSVRIFNGQYYCRLRSQERGGRKALVEITRYHEGESPESGPQEHRVRALLGLMYAAHFSPYASILQTLGSENEVTWAAKDSGITCDFVAEPGKKLSGRLKSGSLSIGHGPLYRLQSAKVVMAFYGDSNEETTEYRDVEYIYGDEGNWMPSSIQARNYSHAGGKYHGEDKWKITSVRLGPISDEEFTLSAFGFDEPFGVEWPQPTPWWLYLAGGTVFFFVLALLFGVAIRRLNARAAG